MMKDVRWKESILPRARQSYKAPSTLPTICTAVSSRALIGSVAGNSATRAGKGGVGRGRQPHNPRSLGNFPNLPRKKLKLTCWPAFTCPRGEEVAIGSRLVSASQALKLRDRALDGVTKKWIV